MITLIAELTSGRNISYHDNGTVHIKSKLVDEAVCMPDYIKIIKVM